MTIAEIAKKYEVSADTLRYYERIGLIPPVARDKNGNRNYTETDYNWVQFAKCMRGAGISIEKLIEYVKLFQMGIETIPARKKLLQEQYEVLGTQIAELQKIYEMLGKKIDGYEDHIIAYEEEKLRHE